MQTELENLPNFSAPAEKSDGCQMDTHLGISLGLWIA